MQNNETRSRFENFKLPLGLTAVFVAALLGISNLSAADNSEYQMTPSADPTPALNVENSSPTATPDNSEIVTYIPTPVPNRVIRTPIPNAGPVVNLDGSISHNQ